MRDLVGHPLCSRWNGYQLPDDRAKVFSIIAPIQDVRQVGVGLAVVLPPIASLPRLIVVTDSAHLCQQRNRVEDGWTI